MLKASFKLDDRNIYQEVSIFSIFPFSKLSNAGIFIKRYFCFHPQTSVPACLVTALRKS